MDGWEINGVLHGAGESFWVAASDNVEEFPSSAMTVSITAMAHYPTPAYTHTYTLNYYRFGDLIGGHTQTSGETSNTSYTFTA
jgi:hypothetical protein